MRGARIAEKIQEYYHTNSSNINTSQTNNTTQHNFYNNQNGHTVIKQFVQYNGQQAKPNRQLKGPIGVF